jgi:hypothetical protein
MTKAEKCKLLYTHKMLSDFHVFDLQRYNYWVDHRQNILTKQGYKIDDFAIGKKPENNVIGIV